MLEVLINAYACAPNRGSEPGMAWNWIVNLAKYCKVYVITEGEFRDEIELELSRLPQGVNMRFYYNPVSDKIRTMCWNQGDWRFYYYYFKWQKETYNMAQDIIASNNIDLVHQLNMIGFREPGFLWKLDKPSVWGPIGGLDFMPYSFIKEVKVSIKYKLLLKNFITYLQINYSKRINLAFQNFNVVIGAVNKSNYTVKKYLNLDIPILNETGCYTGIGNECIRNRFNNDEFNILWVGKADFRKQLELAFEIINNLKSVKNLKFHIVGIDKGTDDYFKYEQIIKSLDIQNNIVWHGKIPHNMVKVMMSTNHLFLFTSIMEGTPHVILEAIENQMPIICFDACGQAECVNETIGVKIELSNPKQAIVEFSDAILHLNKNRNILQEYSSNCIKRAQELSWDSKINKMLEYYNEAIKKH